MPEPEPLTPAGDPDSVDSQFDKLNLQEADEPSDRQPEETIFLRLVSVAVTLLIKRDECTTALHCLHCVQEAAECQGPIEEERVGHWLDIETLLPLPWRRLLIAHNILRSQSSLAGFYPAANNLLQSIDNNFWGQLGFFAASLNCRAVLQYEEERLDAALYLATRTCETALARLCQFDDPAVLPFFHVVMVFLEQYEGCESIMNNLRDYSSLIVTLLNSVRPSRDNSSKTESLFGPRPLFQGKVLFATRQFLGDWEGVIEDNCHVQERKNMINRIGIQLAKTNMFGLRYNEKDNQFSATNT
ncbi:hypothetical protein CHU98_g7837 [Xylaria longipes]|nr:hypothetical protein CHU98_g7837 [Xylaria longipes]